MTDAPDESQVCAGAYVVVPYVKGTVLLLTPTELATALQRGKAYRRTLQRQRRAAQAAQAQETTITLPE